MSINLNELRDLLKTLDYPLFRDAAPTHVKYPYMIYTYESTKNVWSGSSVYRKMPNYQLSLFTKGTETDLVPIEKILKENKIPYADFSGIQGDENDDTVTNFYTQIRVVDNV